MKRINLERKSQHAGGTDAIIRGSRHKGTGSTQAPEIKKINFQGRRRKRFGSLWIIHSGNLPWEDPPGAQRQETSRGDRGVEKLPRRVV